MRRSIFTLCMIVSILASVFTARAQDTPPAPGKPKTVSVPPVQEKMLGNGLTVAVVERHGNPLVTLHLLVKSGADSEDQNAFFSAMFGLDPGR